MSELSTVIEATTRNTSAWAAGHANMSATLDRIADDVARVAEEDDSAGRRELIQLAPAAMEAMATAAARADLLAASFRRLSQLYWAITPIKQDEGKS